MPRWEASTPKLTAVLGSSVDPKKSTATINFEDERKTQVGLVFSVEALPAAIALMAARLDELVGHIDPHDRPPMQTLQLASISVEMSEDGLVGLLIALKGGGHLPISCDREALRALRDTANEMLSATDPRQRN